MPFMLASPPSPPSNGTLWTPPLRHVATTQVICLMVAAFLALLGSDFLMSWLYSVIIGTLSSTLIHWGRHASARWLMQRPGPHPRHLRAGWPGWGWMLPIILVGGAVGFIGGSLLAGALTGQAITTQHPVAWRGWLAVMTISIGAGLAATWFAWSRSRLAEAEKEVAQVGRLAAETQLKLLESQLEPHMLFNTLANLRALIGVDPARAQSMLDHLIDFLRATLQASRAAEHPLSAEFSRLADYLALMQIRMGPRLTVSFDLPAALASHPVPPLLLQPLVENAIKHGLEPQRRGGSLAISARAEADELLLQVEDSGLGLQTTPNTRGTGFGLGQVRERLRTQYGERGRVSLSGRAGGGTLALARLPLVASLPADPNLTAAPAAH
jgi:Histidine kinase